MDRPDEAVRLRGEERIEQVRAHPGPQMPAKAASGRYLLSANHTGVLHGLVSVYSLKLVSATMQRCCGFSHARQNREATLRTLVTGWEPTFGGGKPQHIWISSRSPSTVQTTGAT